MKIYIEKDSRWLKKKFSGKICKLLDALKINPETVVIVKNGKLVTEEDIAADKDEVKLLSVISGG